MARKPAAAPALIDAGADPAALASANTALSAVNEQALALAATFGLPSVEPAVLEVEISGLIAATGRNLFEIGVRLVALRTVQTGDDWKASLERLSFAPRMAARMMSAALKVADASGSGREKLLALPQAKVLELVALDESSLDQLERDGRIGTLNLDFDDIDRMSASELRRRINDLEKATKAKDKVIAGKDRKLNELEQQLHSTSLEEADAARAAELIGAVRDATSAAEIGLAQLCSAAAAAMREAGQEHVNTAARTGVEYIAQRLADLIFQNQLPVQFEMLVRPDWLPEGSPTVKKRR